MLDSLVTFLLFSAVLLSFCFIYWICHCCRDRVREQFGYSADEVDRINSQSRYPLPGHPQHIASLNPAAAGGRHFGMNCRQPGSGGGGQRVNNAAAYENPPPSYEEVVKKPPGYCDPYVHQHDGGGVVNPSCNGAV